MPKAKSLRWSDLGEKAMRATLEWQGGRPVDGAARNAELSVGSPSPCGEGTRVGVCARARCSPVPRACARELNSRWTARDSAAITQHLINARHPHPCPLPARGRGTRLSTHVSSNPLQSHPKASSQPDLCTTPKTHGRFTPSPHRSAIMTSGRCGDAGRGGGRFFPCIRRIRKQGVTTGPGCTMPGRRRLG